MKGMKGERRGNLIKAGDDEPLTTVVQLDPIHVAFALPEQHLEAIRKGMEGGGEGLAVTARDARDGRVLGEGRLVFIANTVDRATGTIGLKGEFENRERALWPGAFVEVALRLDIRAMRNQSCKAFLPINNLHKWVK